MAVTIEELASSLLFQGLKRESLELVSQNSRERVYKSGSTIMYQSDPGDNFLLILNGTVKVSVQMPDGDEVFLAILAAGDTVGEMTMIDTNPRSADVSAQEQTRVLILDRVLFNKLVETETNFMKNMMRILSRRLRVANMRIQAHCTLDTFGLVAFQIVEFADLYGKKTESGDIIIPIRLTQSDIATLAGASRERVNQVMVSFKKSGVISSDSGFHITVHKIDDLRKRISAA